MWWAIRQTRYSGRHMTSRTLSSTNLLVRLSGMGWGGGGGRVRGVVGGREGGEGRGGWVGRRGGEEDGGRGVGDGGGGVGGWGRMGSGRGGGVGNNSKMSHFQELLVTFAFHTSAVVRSAAQVVPCKSPRPMNCLRSTVLTDDASRMTSAQPPLLAVRSRHRLAGLLHSTRAPSCTRLCKSCLASPRDR